MAVPRGRPDIDRFIGIRWLYRPETDDVIGLLVNQSQAATMSTELPAPETDDDIDTATNCYLERVDESELIEAGHAYIIEEVSMAERVGLGQDDYAGLFEPEPSTPTPPDPILLKKLMTLGACPERTACEQHPIGSIAQQLRTA